jgi:glycine/D-amino acid oxidase-like deaminating enzyme
VAVIGSGYTGLNAAIELARGGRSVVVLDRGRIGSGASSRNGGFVGRTLKHSFGTLVRRRGLAFAKRVYGEMQAALDAVAARVEREQIACHFRRSGRVILLRNQAERRALEVELELRATHLGHRHRVLGADEVGTEIATSRYVAAAVVEDLASIHPGLYVQGLAGIAEAAGAVLIGETEVLGLADERSGVRIATSAGILEASHVLVATNGLTGRATPWHRRRIIPFDAYMIATEELPEATLNRLLPADRTYLEDVHNIDFLRRAPEQRRILFGGRTGTRNADLARMARLLRRDLVRLFPELASVRLSNVWTGRCAGTFDLYPHVGAHGRIHHAMGFCFAGLPMGTYLGQKAARAILGNEKDAESVFRELSFLAMPVVGGETWIVPWIIGWWDWREGKRADRHGSHATCQQSRPHG